ncbi:spermidine synthase [Arthrobacter silviterrae]|uniref:Spermidine synthase n=1 Tax=Arthrobacter silviterrae TaxID=2026658 RepID=A0ABX0D6J4_9MICC|nr:MULTISPECIES: fused MFS/spermidine synthase [Arthrobacter]MCU6481503.1 fused MFS/spermidine synthase [Arthrobacter sp. A2-55]MDQ0278435.1 spermidine synthase [Arthrobacter silviterrae]NGN82306.1 spermidine synthase [Arthrobacter silviterrae]
MGRQRPPRNAVVEPDAALSGPVAGLYPTDTGTAELIADGDNPNGWLLMLNGVQSSHVDLADPLRLEFEYMRWIMALVADRWAPDARLRTLSLGGAACSMPRYLVAAYPNSRNVVVEIDGKLAAHVRDWFDLPRAPLLKIRVGEAREVTESLAPASRELIIRDVFAGARTPHALITAEFTEAARKVLIPGGVYVVNCGDSPALATARREAATIAAAFGHTAIIADPPMLKGRRSGNIIIAGSDLPLGDGPGLPRALLGGAMPAQLWGDAKVRQFGQSALVLHDAGA